MGDHRATINISVQFHGKTYEWKDAWINYSGHDGVDQRVLDFFENMWTDGYSRYLDAMDAAGEKERARETEADERRELMRLKQKYEAMK